MKNFTIDAENNITVHASAKESDAVPNSELFGNEAALAKLAANWPAARLVEIWSGLPGETPVRKFKDRATAVSRIWKAVQSLGEAIPPETGADHPSAQLVAGTQQEAESEVPAEVPIATEPETDAPDAEPAASPEANVSAPVAPETAHVAPEADEATNDATPVAGAPAAAPDARLLRVLARAFAGLTPEQAEAKWDGLKIALAARPQVAARTPAANPVATREGSKTSQVIAMLKREGGATLEQIMTEMGWLKHTTRAMLSAGGSLVKKHGLVVVSEEVGDSRV